MSSKLFSRLSVRSSQRQVRSKPAHYATLDKSSDRHFVGEGAAADPQSDDRADGVPEVDGKAALAHFPVPQVHRPLAEVLFHHKVALEIVSCTHAKEAR